MIETLILKNLQNNEDYIRKVLPYLSEDYFFEQSEKVYFNIIKKHMEKYNTIPSLESVAVYINDSKTNENTHKNLKKLYKDIKESFDKKENVEWLVDKTEEFCKDKALLIALNETHDIIEADSDNKNKLAKTEIPEILRKALSISFDSNIGHDYIKDAAKRLEYYNQTIHKIPCHLDMLNRITGGGVERKTVNAIMSGTGVGKTMLLCDLAANYMRNGHNVLYITLEMAEEKISQRIDANLMDLTVDDLKNISKKKFETHFSNVKNKVTGSLKVKEYPTSSAGVSNFDYMLKELEQKQNWIPDIVIVDYLNICSSDRYKDKSNSYGYIKSICEELRGFAVRHNIVLWTATQKNRGNSNEPSDIDITDVSESAGGPMTFDFFIGLISNDQLANMGQVMVKQLKNRYADVFKDNKFTIGVDRPKMKFYDIVGSSTYNNTATTVTNSGIASNTKNKLSGIKV